VKIVVPTFAGRRDGRLRARSCGAAFRRVGTNRPGRESRRSEPDPGRRLRLQIRTDGYTLLVSDASSFVINPHLYRTLPYDGVKGFTPVTVLVRFPWVVAVHVSVAANTFQELVALAKAIGQAFYGSFGLGSSAHISVDYLKNLLGIDIIIGILPEKRSVTRVRPPCRERARCRSPADSSGSRR